MKTKRSFIGLLLLGMAMTAQAQIPNNGFENWTTVGERDSLNEWFSGNATKSTDHYPESIGQYSIKVENQLPVTSHLSYGYSVTNKESNGCLPSFPITGHPTALCGYYKCFPTENDTIQIGIMLFKNGVWIAGGEFTTKQTVSEWTAFNIPIYSDTESYTDVDADSATITVAAFYNDTTCGNPYGPFGNSVLYVDNLSFDNLITTDIATVESKEKVTVSPNPARDVIQITGIQGDAIVALSDINGRVLFSKKVIEGEKIPVSSLSNGEYMVTIKAQNFTETKRIVIKK